MLEWDEINSEPESLDNLRIAVEGLRNLDKEEVQRGLEENFYSNSSKSQTGEWWNKVLTVVALNQQTASSFAVDDLLNEIGTGGIDG